MSRNIHPDFLRLLRTKDDELAELYIDLRNFILDLMPAANELLYHTHALTSVYTPTQKMGDAFCHIPIYTEHLNLGFNQGTLLDDPEQLLEGTGKSIRHIPVRTKKDFRNQKVKTLVKVAIKHSIANAKGTINETGETISKIKK
jgi:hypothetical protein